LGKKSGRRRCASCCTPSTTWRGVQIDSYHHKPAAIRRGPPQGAPPSPSARQTHVNYCADAIYPFVGASPWQTGSQIRSAEFCGLRFEGASERERTQVEGCKIPGANSKPAAKRRGPPLGVLPSTLCIISLARSRCELLFIQSSVPSSG